MIDDSTELGARILEKLRTEKVVWLTTVDGSAPRPAPVWFLYERDAGGDRILIYSKTDARRNASIGVNPRVALNFNCTPDGGDVCVILGTARPAPDRPPAHLNPAYMARYDAAIRQEHAWEGKAEGFAEQYSVPLEITDLRIWGW